MKTSIKMILLAATASVVTACNNAQPPPPCAVGHGGYAAKFTRVSGDTSGDCFRLGDIIGVQKYRLENGDSDVYLKSVWLSEREYNTVFPYGYDATGVSTGKLESNTPEGDFCTVGAMPAATGTDINGDALTYQWSNVRFYMSGAIPGTQFTADLTITGASCASAGGTTYKVDAMYPVIFCSDYDEGNIVNNSTFVPQSTLNTPNDTHCEENDHFWSHLKANPTFEMECVATRHATDDDWCSDGTLWASYFAGRPGPNCGQMHLCVPENDIPSVKPGTEL